MYKLHVYFANGSIF